MPTFTLPRIGAEGPVTAGRTRDGRRMTLSPQDGTRNVVGVKYAPREVDHGGLAAVYTTVDRTGRAPALVYRNPRLKTMSFPLLIADPRQPASVDRMVAALEGWAERGVRIRVAYGRMENGLWRITEMRVGTKQRDPDLSQVVHAVADLEFTRASDITGWGPVDGGPKPPPGTPGQPGRTHRVVAGDTLISISIRYYGTPARWRQIGDANGISNPRLLPVGKLLRIP